MKGIIGFEELAIQCILGCCEHERTNERTILVDLKAEVDFSKCVVSDDIADAVDYCALSDHCKELAQSGKYHLMESFASEALKQLFVKFPITWAWIKVSKPNPFPHTRSTVIELEATL